jgi:hypothetical protein
MKLINIGQKGEKMNTIKESPHGGDRKTAIIVGVFFIACTASSLLSLLFLGSLDSPNYLVNVAANEKLVLIGILIQCIWAFTCIGIPVMLFPILKKHNEALALGFFSLRFIEGCFIFLAIVCQLSLLTLSKEFVTRGLEGSNYLASGTLLHAARDWALWVGPSISFALSALVLSFTLYQSRIVSKWLSVWGLVGAIIYFPAELLGLFGIDQFLFLAVPIAIQEMALAIWLIVKGFNSSAISSESVKE